MDAHRFRPVHAVVIEEPFRLVLPVRPRSDLLPHSRGSPRHQLVDGAQQSVRAVLLEQLLEPERAEFRRTRLSAQVTQHHIGNAAVVAQDRLHLRQDALGGGEPHRRQHDPVVENLARRRAAGTRHQTADIGLVGHADPESDHLAVVEGRRRHHHVWDMAVSRLVGIVGNERIRPSRISSAG